MEGSQLNSIRTGPRIWTTADRVLVHVDTELVAKDILNSRVGYVSISRGAHDAKIFTNDFSTLGNALCRDVSHAPATVSEGVAQKIAPRSVSIEEITQGLGISL